MLVIATFDLRGADSDDYDVVRRELTRIGLSETISGPNGKVIDLPSTTYTGIVAAESARRLKVQVSDSIKNVLQRSHVKGTYLVCVSRQWALAAGASR